jgi:MOSC domain-containing protein YiiM
MAAGIPVGSAETSGGGDNHRDTIGLRGDSAAGRRSPNERRAGEEIDMKLLSVHVGLPRDVPSGGKTVRTAIFKTPVTGRVFVGRLNVTGDEQSDLSVHGGPEKAVYAYPSEHYAFWRAELPDVTFSWGAFGENLTVEGMAEDRVHIGDRFRIGTTELVVTQPRMPCFKLGVRFGLPDIIKRFLRSRRTGFYFSVRSEGELGAGDAIQPIAVAEHGITVADVTALYAGDASQQDLLRRASELADLPASWREYFRDRVWDPDS